MSEPNKDAQEPSMEEILSSIRRIIAEEDDDAQGRPQPVARPTPMDKPDDDVLVLTDRIDDGPRQPAPIRPARQEPPPVQAAPAPRSELPPTVPPAAASPPQALQESSMPEQSTLVSNTAAAVSAAAFSKLARAAAPPAANEPISPISGMTVEQLLMSMLEPMLKDWFDKNLPVVVERIVEEEVKKLVRRAELQ
jgi:cell pole-organizing protein PopZ